MTGASGQSAPGPVAEDVPQAPKKPALHQRGPSFQSASFCLVLSNQQVTSNQSAVGLVYASQFQVWPSLHAGSPGHLAYPSRLPLPHVEHEGRRQTTHSFTGTQTLLYCKYLATLGLLHYAQSTISITKLPTTGMQEPLTT